MEAEILGDRLVDRFDGFDLVLVSYGFDLVLFHISLMG